MQIQTPGKFVDKSASDTHSSCIEFSITGRNDIEEHQTLKLEGWDTHTHIHTDAQNIKEGQKLTLKCSESSPSSL